MTTHLDPAPVPGPTLADLVAQRPARGAVLDRLGLDWCCHGEQPFAAACAAAGLDPADVMARLDAEAGDDDGPARWHERSPVELVGTILETHHRYLRRELPALEQLAAKVHGVHGERHPELGEVAELVRALRADLEPHLLKEERVLFPAVLRLVAGDAEPPPFATVRNPIRVMESEHDATGDLLAQLRLVTGGYAVPDDGCGSYRQLYQRLEHLEADTHLHVHVENHVLFPAIARLEDELAGGPSTTPRAGTCPSGHCGT